MIPSWLIPVAHAAFGNSRQGIPLPTDSSGLPSMATPSSSADAVRKLVASVVTMSFGFVATLAVAGIMWGGFLMIKGGDEGFKKGRVAIAYAVGGLALTIMAYTIVSLVVGLNPLTPLSLGS